MEQEQKIINQLDRIEASLIGQKEVLTFEEAVEYTGLSKSYMYKLTSGQKIPHYKPAGKLVFFNREELHKWLLQNRVSTSDEVLSEARKYCMTNKIGRGK